MPSRAFDIMAECRTRPAHLARAYANVIADLVGNPPWSAGKVSQRRVLWSDAERARSADPETFGSSGLYVWGAAERPLYLGMTSASFNGRFSRYVWHERSQCKIARDFEAELVSRGIDGLPATLRSWYATNFRGSTVRLAGAARFAKEGIGSIWFALLPASDREAIRPLEVALIPVANQWNLDAGIAPLINIEGNHGRRQGDGGSPRK